MIINMIWLFLVWVGLIRVTVLFINHLYEMGITTALDFTYFVINRLPEIVPLNYYDEIGNDSTWQQRKVNMQKS